MDTTAVQRFTTHKSLRLIITKNEMLDENTLRMTGFKSQIKTHVSLLTQIADSIRMKYNETFDDTSKQYS